MKKAITLCAVANIALAGCVAQETFGKNRMTYSDFERDRATCETKASQEVAVNRSPGAELAVALLTGVYQTQDANAATRLRNFESCMIKKGYTRVEMPACKSPSEARKNGVGPLNSHEEIEISSESCASHDSRGRIIFHKQS